MQVLDASSIIYAWDNYPKNQFPGLWDWIAEQIEEKALAIPKVALEEVRHKTPECEKWLKEAGIALFDTTQEILLDAMRIKKLVGIVDDRYHPKGVDENDLLIIATAKVHRCGLISDEEKQTRLPDEPTKKKIPAVCAMADVAVQCMNFIEFLKGSNAVFR
jgi:hypothetical protein